ncbi:hypothetical protein BU16DRAFT_560505 [Lophium mytilinum]|uniref:NAD(P)-binding domain-containing protein n=1 Tax=Lophium mytilinum TaxID=390894 RepID=A0A6A6QXL6_9PEZI|nr:hypothetical protein BU16DRAFT_560505 [Lophium mytilinum]
MPTYALLGATGSTGSAVIRHLNAPPPANLSLNIYKPPTAIVLSSVSVNKKFTGPQPALARSLLHFSQYYNYHDLELAQGLYEEAASVGLLEFIFAQLGAIMDAEGTAKTGHCLSSEPFIGTISYSDLGAGFCELAERRHEFRGVEVCIMATGDLDSLESLQYLPRLVDQCGTSHPTSTTKFKLETLIDNTALFEEETKQNKLNNKIRRHPLSACIY